MFERIEFPVDAHARLHEIIRAGNLKKIKIKKCLKGGNTFNAALYFQGL